MSAVAREQSWTEPGGDSACPPWLVSSHGLRADQSSCGCWSHHGKQHKQVQKKNHQIGQSGQCSCIKSSSNV